MPIFEFHCENCGKSFEKLIRFRTYEVRCVYCSGADVGRILSNFGISSSNRRESSSFTGSGSGCGSCSGGSCSTCG